MRFLLDWEYRHEKRPRCRADFDSKGRQSLAALGLGAFAALRAASVLLGEVPGFDRALE